MSIFTEYLDSAAEMARLEQRRLEEECRCDEANFARIKQNIYTIAKTVYDVFRREKGSAFALEYAGKLSSMRGKWEESLALAQQHGDAVTAAAERIKIDTMLEIEAEFEKGRTKNV